MAFSRYLSDILEKKKKRKQLFLRYLLYLWGGF